MTTWLLQVAHHSNCGHARGRPRPTSKARITAQKARTVWIIGAVATMWVGVALIGFSYGPLGTALSELFPTAVRYTGSSLTYNLAGIVGASLAPYVATWLAQTYGLAYVGYYLTFAAVLTLVGLAGSRETKDDDLVASGCSP